MLRRFRNQNWNLADDKGNIGTWERVSIAVLMDIRDELQKLNLLLHCENFKRIPHELEEIKRVLKCVNKKIPARRKKK